MHDRELTPVTAQAKHCIIAIPPARQALGVHTGKRMLRHKLRSKLPFERSRLLSVHWQPTVGQVSGEHRRPNVFGAHPRSPALVAIAGCCAWFHSIDDSACRRNHQEPVVEVENEPRSCVVGREQSGQETRSRPRPGRGNSSSNAQTSWAWPKHTQASREPCHLRREGHPGADCRA